MKVIKPYTHISPKVLLKVIKPYTRLRISFISEVLSIPEEEVSQGSSKAWRGKTWEHGVQS